MLASILALIKTPSSLLSTLEYSVDTCTCHTETVGTVPWSWTSQDSLLWHHGSSQSLWLLRQLTPATCQRAPARERLTWQYALPEAHCLSSDQCATNGHQGPFPLTQAPCCWKFQALPQSPSALFLVCLRWCPPPSPCCESPIESGFQESVALPHSRLCRCCVCQLNNRPTGSIIHSAWSQTYQMIC
jgi:hypothetical protein